MLNNPEFDGQLEDSVLVNTFESLEPDLRKFSLLHCLFIRKYVRNYPAWGFYFLHPSGGSASLTLNICRRNGNFAAMVGGEWHVDDKVSLTRTIYWSPSVHPRSLDPAEIVAAMEDSLSTLLAAKGSARTVESRLVRRPVDENGQPIYGKFEEFLKVAR